MIKTDLLEKAKTSALLAAPVVMTAVPAITSYASEDASGGSDVMSTAVTALTTSLTDMATSIGGAIGSILPIVIPLVGVSLVVTIGIAVFKKIASKA